MPYRIQERLRRITVLYLLFGWASAWAALDHAGPDLLALPWAQALAGVGVAWVGGFAASLGRKLVATYENKPFHTGKEFARDGAVSAVIGMSGYWIGMSQQASPAFVALVLILSGYAGTRTLAVWIDRVIHPKEE